MNENKRLITIFVVIVAVIGLILFISFWPEKDRTFRCGVKADGDYEKLGKVNYKQYQCLYESKDKNALVVANDLSKKEKSILNKSAKQIGHALYYLDVQNISDEDMKVIKKELKYNDDSFKNDVIIVFKGKKIDNFKESILSDSDKLNTFLKESNLSKFACDVKATEEYENVAEITYEQYKCLYDSGNPFVLVLEQTSCGYCQQFNPIIGEYTEKNNLPIYVIQIDTLSDSDRSALTNSLSYFNENDSWGTPLTLAIKDKKVVSEIGGYTDDASNLDELYKKLELK